MDIYTVCEFIYMAAYLNVKGNLFKNLDECLKHYKIPKRLYNSRINKGASQLQALGIEPFLVKNSSKRTKTSQTKEKTVKTEVAPEVPTLFDMVPMKALFKSGARIKLYSFSIPTVVTAGKYKLKVVENDVSIEYANEKAYSLRLYGSFNQSTRGKVQVYKNGTCKLFIPATIEHSKVIGQINNFVITKMGELHKQMKLAIDNLVDVQSDLILKRLL